VPEIKLLFLTTKADDLHYVGVTRKLVQSTIFLLAALLVYFVLTQKFPISGDDYAYTYQATLFASGKLYARDPLYDLGHPLHGCIATNCIMDYHGHRFSVYPPGWPALLAVGTALGVPWLVNPLLGAVLCFLILTYIERRMDKKLVNVAWLLVTSCLFFVFYSASTRNHVATALFIFAAFLFFDEAEQSPQRARPWLFVAGALLGYSSLIRYIDWIPLGVWIGISLLRRGRVAELVAFAVGFLLLAVGNLLYDMLLCGNPLTVPAALSGPSTVAGMHAHLAISPIGFVRTAVRLVNLIWIFPPVLLLFVFLGRYRPTPKAEMYLALFLMNIGIYFFYPWGNGGPGPRYLLAYFPFLLLAMVDLYRWICDEKRTRARQLWTLGMITLVIGNLIFTGLEAHTMYWRRDIERTVQQAEAGKRIIFLKTGTYQTRADDLTRNPPVLSNAENLYLNWCDQSARDAFLILFPGRKIFVYEYPAHLLPYIPAKNLRTL